MDHNLPVPLVPSSNEKKYITLHLADNRYLFRTEAVDLILSALLSPVLTSQQPMMKTIRLGLKGIIKPMLPSIVASMYRDVLKTDPPDIPRGVDPLVFLNASAKEILIHVFTRQEWRAEIEQRDDTRSYEVISLSPYSPSDSGEAESDRRGNDPDPGAAADHGRQPDHSLVI